MEAQGSGSIPEWRHGSLTLTGGGDRDRGKAGGKFLMISALITGGQQEVSLLMMKSTTPAEAGVHASAAREVDRWIPACPTDPVRGLKAHGMIF